MPERDGGPVRAARSQLGHVIRDIRGEGPAAAGDIVTDAKPGLLERADKLVAGLNKVQ